MVSCDECVGSTLTVNLNDVMDSRQFFDVFSRRERCCVVVCDSLFPHFLLCRGCSAFVDM